MIYCREGFPILKGTPRLSSGVAEGGRYIAEFTMEPYDEFSSGLSVQIGGVRRKPRLCELVHVQVNRNLRKKRLWGGKSYGKGGKTRLPGGAQGIGICRCGGAGE